MDNTRQATIQCPLCGIIFNPSITRTNICNQCLLQQENITENVTTHDVVQMCTHCKRYNRPPYILCERESKELLSICLRKIKGLEKLKLVNAAFVFTEPSTRLLKVRLTVQKEIMNEAAVQQEHIVEFKEEVKQCPDCRKEFTPHTWIVAIQIRQRVEHKKTFLHLEQLLIQNHLQDRPMKIEEVDDGLDFFFKTMQQGREMLQFLQSHLPIHVKISKELVSQDLKNNTQNLKYTYSVQLPKICKGNLVILPHKLAKELGGVNMIQVCYKITNLIHLYDPVTLRCSELSAERYFNYDVDTQIYELKTDGVEFTVLDIEKVKNIGNSNKNFSNQGSVQQALLSKAISVQVMRDTGADCEQYNVKCCLGEKIPIGSTLLGFDLAKNNILSDYPNRPDIVLIQQKKEKGHSSKRKKLERLNIDRVEQKKQSKKATQKQEEKEDEEINEYLDEQDEDQSQKIEV